MNLSKDDSGTEDNTPINDEGNSNEEESGDENSNDESSNEGAKSDPDEYGDKPPTTVRALKRWRRRQREGKYQKLFDEHKHLFDMTCDCCSTTFQTLDEGRAHYLSDHNNSRGYIKCCNVKLYYRCQVVGHINRHLDPDKYK